MEASRGLFICLTGALLGFGLLMVHSASITSWPTEFERVYLSRQAIFLCVAVSLGCVCAALPSRIWQTLSPFLFGATVLLLAAVLFPGIGSSVNGARRWIRFGGVSLQPSELAKITLPLFMGRIVQKMRPSLGHWFWGTVPVVLPLAVVVPLVFLEPDLGTSVFLIVTAGLLLWFAGWPLRNFLLAVLILVPGVGVFFSMRPYQLERIQGFLDTWRDANSAPYQVRQSLMSLGAGGYDGVGVGKGWQKLSFLPEAHTDFVFAVVGEELGFLGTIALVLAWCGLFVAGWFVLRRKPRSSYEYIVGLVLLTGFVLQAAINTAVVTAMLPPKGISHPLLSYGGSNLVVSLIAVGIILSLGAPEQKDHLDRPEHPS